MKYPITPLRQIDRTKTYALPFAGATVQVSWDQDTDEDDHGTKTTVYWIDGISFDGKKYFDPDDVLTDEALSQMNAALQAEFAELDRAERDHVAVEKYVDSRDYMTGVV